MKEKKTPWYDKIEQAIIIVLFLVMLAILFVNVVTRFCFSYTASWTEQAARILFVWMTFAGVSLAGSLSSHMQVTVVNMLLGEKKAAYVYWLGDVIVILFGFYISTKMWKVMQTVISTNQTFPSIQWLPTWVLYLPGILGMIGLSLRIIQKRVRQIRAAGKEETV